MSAFVPLWYRNYQLSSLIGDEKGGAFVPSLLLKTQHLHLQDRLVVTHNSLLQQETEAFLELLKYVPFCKPDIHIVQQYTLLQISPPLVIYLPAPGDGWPEPMLHGSAGTSMEACVSQRKLEPKGEVLIPSSWPIWNSLLSLSNCINNMHD